MISQDKFQELSSIPCIGAGGCGILTLALYRWIKLNLNYDKIFIVLTYTYNDENEYESNYRALEQGEIESFIVPSHIMVSIDNSVIDHKGEFSMEDIKRDFYKVQRFDFKEEILLYAINNQYHQWNHAFNRKYVKNISNILNVDLSDVTIK